MLSFYYYRIEGLSQSMFANVILRHLATKRSCELPLTVDNLMANYAAIYRYFNGAILFLSDIFLLL